MDAAVEKKCPYCGETIKAEAVKCRFCGETLGPSESQPPGSRPAGAQQGEPAAEGEPLFAGRSSGFALVRPALATAAVVAAAAVVWALLAGRLPGADLRQLLAGACLAVIVFMLFRFLFAWLDWRGRSCTITSDRIEHEQGVLRKSRRNMDMWRVQDLAFEQTLPERVFRVGRVIVRSSDRDTHSMVIGPIPEARELYDRLNKARIEAYRRRGVLHIE